MRTKNVEIKLANTLESKRKVLPDFVLVFVTIVLVFLGCVFVYSASMYSAELYYKSSYYFLKKQIIGAVIGSVALVFFYLFPYRKLEKYKFYACAISCVLLLLVFVPGLGVESYGAKRWINLGVTTFQPSELAKISFIVFASSVLAKNKHKANTFLGVFPVIVVGAIFCALIIVEPNMSITVCMGLLLLVMLFVGGASIRHLLLIIIPAMLLLPVLIIIEPYRMRRLVAFINPWASPQGEGFQLVESLYSVASGSWLGVGLFSSRQKYLFLPFAESDFIFSIVVEETGFLGAVLVCLLFLILFVRAIKIAKKATSRFGCYLCSGIACLILIEVVLNIAVVTSLVPPTGLPLPFLSAGSTALVSNMSMIGMLLSVDKESKKSRFVS